MLRHAKKYAIRHLLAQGTFSWCCCFRISELNCKVVDAQTTQKLVPAFLRTVNKVTEVRWAKAYHYVNVIF